MDYTPLLAYLGVLPPSALLLLWGGGCAGAVAAGVTIAAKLQPPRADPFATLPPTPHGAHAAGHVDQVDDTTDRPGARHNGIGVRPWQAAHTAAAAARRGRHHTGSRAWSGNLLERTQACELTADDLADAVAAQTTDGAA